MSHSRPEPSARELAHDALKELMNVGSGNALTALGKLLAGRRLEIGLPDLALVTDEMAVRALMQRHGAPIEGAKLSVAVVSPDRARLSYRFAVLLDENTARSLPSLLLGREVGPQGGRFAASPAGEQDIGPLARSALAEMTNITASAFLNAASTMLGANLMPSPPAVNIGDLGSLLAREVRGHTDDKPMVLLQTHFKGSDCGLDGRFLLCLEQASALAILEQMGIRISRL